MQRLSVPLAPAVEQEGLGVGANRAGRSAGQWLMVNG
jgi:hypothetical protein